VNELAITLGTNLRRARGRLNLTAEQVAASISLPVEQYERMERGHLPPNTNVFLALCTALNVPADELLTPNRPRLRLIKGGL
jgi:transcriptional regulator with XRE-family HTH domain